MVRNIDRMSSIESEPRTLRMDQIQFAREAALYVLQTNTVEKAMSIFTEGLEPVISSVVGFKEGIISSTDDLISEEYDDFFEENQLIITRDNINNNNINNNNNNNGDLYFRDVVTAPF